MMGARLLQFPAVRGVTAPPRPSSPNAADGAGFAGMVDDAVGASSSARRDDPARPTQAARPRRPEAAKPRATKPRVAEPGATKPGAAAPDAASAPSRTDQTKVPSSAATEPAADLV